MCGIVAIKLYNGDINVNQINNALAIIRHRGPDANGVYVNNRQNVALGHTRLSVIGLESGNQPIVNTQHHITITVNGEFYGYQAIRKDLEQKGYCFHTNSDSEILTFLYLEYGLNLFQYLRGEFAFVLYDERKDILIAARDRFGIKPLCFYKDDKGLLLASKSKALFQLGVVPEWDEYSVMHALNMHYQPTDRTLFKNIHQLKPGHYLIARRNEIEIRPYWDLNYVPEQSVQSVQSVQSEKDCIATFRDILSESVKLRLQSDVPVCFHLSGGLDSSAVVGMARRYVTEPMHCFTITFDGVDTYDESQLARETADLTGSILHTVNVTQEDIFNHLDEAVYFSEGLAVNGHLSCKYLLNKQITASGFKVALTGEGSDEVLAGYPHLRLDILNQLTAPERQRRLEQLYQTNLAITGVEIAQGESLNIEKVREKLGFIPAFLTAKASIGLKMNSILDDDFIAAYRHTDFYEDMINSYDIDNQLKGRHIVNQSLYLWTKLTLANYILNVLGDGCEMASSIEGRLPFLDHKLFEYVRTFPMDMKIRNGNEKYILKEAVKPFITKSVYRRQKHPFMAPPVTRFKTPRTMEYMNDVLTSSAFRQMPYFNQNKIQHLLRRLNNADVVELTAYEPVIMFLLTMTSMQKRLINTF